ncbi:glycosyltransferase family 4 protein [Pseudomonas kielensis]|uniref:glycosyltransferase family 4 protein n=1 Tax=Pseudomonas kielensis TaxID=2762577 RepID=UPI0015F795B9|nr:glycosyltransferase family 4 protein [Pseudomonas kielensis]WKL51677.1 glycosyltransferase family 4 protein [Pseudomonas kielensis]
MTIIINHVTSNNVHSGIFEDIFSYFSRYTDGIAEQIISEKPVIGAHVRHYHRPHLEDKLISPCVVTVHHDLNDPDGWLSINAFLDRYREADMVICLNTLQQKKLAECGIHHTCVVPHGYNHHLIDSARTKGRIKRDKFTLAVVSKRYGRKVKGEAFLFELAKRLDPSLIEFFLVGDGRSEEGRVFRSLGFEAEVYERIPYATLIDAYRGIDALLMTSYFEGGPANIPEAAAMGVPVLSNPIGMVPDLIENGRHGIYLTMDPAEDAKTINRLASNENNIYSNMLHSSQTPSQNLITWQDSIIMNMKQHVNLLKGKQDSIIKAMEAFA